MLVSFQGRIVVCGGYFPSTVATVDAFDPQTNRWEQWPNMSTARNMPGAGAEVLFHLDHSFFSRVE